MLSDDLPIIDKDFNDEYDPNYHSPVERGSALDTGMSNQQIIFMEFDPSTKHYIPTMVLEKRLDMCGRYGTYED